MSTPKRNFTIHYPTPSHAVISEDLRAVYVMQREGGICPGFGDWHLRDMTGRLVDKNQYRGDLIERLTHRKIS